MVGVEPSSMWDCDESGAAAELKEFGGTIQFFVYYTQITAVNYQACIYI